MPHLVHNMCPVLFVQCYVFVCITYHNKPMPDHMKNGPWLNGDYVLELNLSNKHILSGHSNTGLSGRKKKTTTLVPSCVLDSDDS